MYLLLLLFLILFLMSFSFDATDTRPQIKLFAGLFMAIVLVIFCGFRYEFGGDWKVYIDAYNLIKSGGSEYPYEPLFRFIVKTVARFDSGYLLLNLISSILFLGFIVIAVYKSKLQYEITNFLFFIFPIGIIFMNLGFIRQAIASSICLLSYVYFLRKKYLSTLFLLIIAQAFHVSAFLFIFYYLFLIWNNLDNKKLKTYSLIACSALGAICIFLLFTIRKDYIGGYKSDGLFPRILYVIILSSILIFLKEFSNLKKALKSIGLLTIVLLVGFIICKKLLITTVLDRALYYLILPICLDITRELRNHSREIKLKTIAFHFTYSIIFLIGWFCLSPYAQHWKNYQFWFF